MFDCHSAGGPENDVNSDGRASIYEIQVGARAFVFKYTVEIEQSQVEQRKKKLVLTKQTDRTTKFLKSDCCREFVQIFIDETAGNEQNFEFAYNGHKTLLTTQEITQNLGVSFRIEPEQMTKPVANFVQHQAVSVIICCDDVTPKLNLSDLSAGNTNDEDDPTNRSIKSALETITSSAFLKTGDYQQIARSVLAHWKSTPLVPGIELANGFRKGIRVTAISGQPKALMVIDLKKCVLVSYENLQTILDQFKSRYPVDGVSRFERLMKGVRCVVNYDQKRSIVFGKLTAYPINDSRFQVGGRSIPEFMYNTHGVDLNCPGERGCYTMSSAGRVRPIYPLECLHVMEGQIVPLDKMPKDAEKLILEKCVISPDCRYDQAHKEVLQMARPVPFEFLRLFGLFVKANSNSIPIKKRPTPQIEYANNQVIRPTSEGSWFKSVSSAKFLRPSTEMTSWIVAHDRDVPETQVRAYVEELLKAAENSGMQSSRPARVIPTNLNQMQSLFEQAKANGVSFIFYIDDHRTKSHQKLKLYEAYYEVLTQHVVSKNLRAGPTTLQNVVMKMNSKTRGINYIPRTLPEIEDFDLEKSNDLLVIGIDVAHPPPMTPKQQWDLKKKNTTLENIHPSVVGISANKSASSPYMFVGDFFFQESRREQVSPQKLEAAVAQIVNLTIKAGRTPQRVVVVRDGISDEQSKMVMDVELPAIRRGITFTGRKLMNDSNFSPRITLIIATKRHSKRFYRQDGQKIVNTRPGDLISAKVVRSDVPEFYLQSHHPLRGCAKIPQFTIPADELEMGVDKVSYFMSHLSNMHQICACPTSLPLPVFVAHETAKRGNEIYHEFHSMRTNEGNNRRPHLDLYSNHQRPSSAFAPQLQLKTDETFDFNELTACLGYAESQLESHRFNS